MNNLTNTEHTLKRPPYIFWRYSDSPGMLEILFRRVYGIVVEIDTQKLAYEIDDNRRQISLKDIRNVSFLDAGAWADTYPMVTIQLRNNTRLNLYPMNPLKPDSPLSGMQEAAAMVKIINAFRADEEIDLEPNPYYRELIRQGQVSEIARRFWDPYVSPWIYYAQDHPHFHSPLLRVLLAVIPGLILITIGLILNYLR